METSGGKGVLYLLRGRMEGSCVVSCCAWFGLAVFWYAGPRVGVDAGVVKVLLKETSTAAYWLEALRTLCHSIL